MSEIIHIEQKQETSEAIRRFSELSSAQQNAALLILRGIQIGEDLASQGKSA